MAKTRYFHAHETARYDALDGLPLASFRRRAFALTIDVVLIMVFRIGLAFLRHHDDLNIYGKDLQDLARQVLEHLRQLVESVAYFALAVKLGSGQTPGKWIMKIRILSLTHHEIGWWQSIERALGYGASLLEGGFGFVQYFLNRNRMCVHDRIAETIVIDIRKASHKPTLEQIDDPEPPPLLN